MRIGAERGSARGAYTLIEMAITITVLAVVAGLGTGIVVEAGRVYSRSRTQTDACADARYALERISRELAGLTSPANITALGSDSITFSLQGTPRTFGTSGSSLVRDSKVLASDVSAFSLTCYDASGDITVTPALVRRIAIRLTITRSDVSITLRSEVFPRAFRTRYTSWGQG